MNTSKVGKFILELRNKKKLSQEELASILHVDRSLISKWENGKLLPDITMFNELANVFNVSIDEIIYGEYNNSKNSERIKNNFKDYLNDNNIKYKKLKKFSIISVLIVFVTLFIMLLYYFNSTYDKTKVYKVIVNSSKYNIDDGMLIVTNDGSFLKIGSINPDVDYVTIKVINDSSENELYKGNPKQVVVNLLDKSFKDNINNVYMIINDENIKLQFIEIYSNNLNNNTSTYSSTTSNYRVYSLEE